MEIELNIPSYLSIKQWKQFTSLEHLSNTDKMIKTISILSGKTEDEIRDLSPNDLHETYSNVANTLSDVDPQFYPVFELDGVKYAYSSMSKMTLGEYVDLERLVKSPRENLEEIMAILYRPIEEDSFGGLKWTIKNSFRVGMGDAENLFQYYTLEKYNSSKRKSNSIKLSTLPATMALGALSFFLVQANTHLLGSAAYSMTTNPRERKEIMKTIKQTATVNIGDGLQRFITYLQHPSYQSQVTNPSLN